MLFSEEIDPELQVALKRVPSFTFRPWMLAGMRMLTRFAFPRANLAGVDLREENAEGARVRLLAPQGRKPTGLLLWMHGGGLVIGSPAQDDARCAEFVREMGIVVVSAYYRLAPAHPFPAALDDCYAAWGWVQANLGRFGLSHAQAAIGGESAGGGLAASLAQRLWDEGGPQPAAQLLIYPMLDDRTAARQELDALKHPVWNNTSNRTGWSAYLGDAPGRPDVPAYAVPARRADLRGLPPAWIGVGSLDLFLEECRAYARRLGEAGVPCEVEEAPGAVHGFAAIAPAASITQNFAAAQMDFLRRRLGLPAT